VRENLGQLQATEKLAETRRNVNKKTQKKRRYPNNYICIARIIDGATLTLTATGTCSNEIILRYPVAGKFKPTFAKASTSVVLCHFLVTLASSQTCSIILFKKLRFYVVLLGTFFLIIRRRNWFFVNLLS
jgi:hypothetical protein